MSIAERVRVSLPPQASLRRVSLRTKLVASVLVLVFAALTLISSASTIALHTYLISRLDNQLKELSVDAIGIPREAPVVQVYMPMDYMIAFSSVSGVTRPYANSRLDRHSLPVLITGAQETAEMNEQTYTTRSYDGKYMW